jgi:type II secretory pathway pseudopilin PulG
LIEILVVVAVLGIAGALVIPSMGQTDVLRVQSAVRAVVADISFAQSDAIAYQQRRALVFDLDMNGDKSDNGYTMCSVNGAVIDVENDALYDPQGPDGKYIVSLKDPRFAGSVIDEADFAGTQNLIFDELGGPVAGPDSDVPTGGFIQITGMDQTFIIFVEAYSGRVRVEKNVP